MINLALVNVVFIITLYFVAFILSMKQRNIQLAVSLQSDSCFVLNISSTSLPVTEQPLSWQQC